MDHLDKFIIGQRDAKRAVAVALRNRWRRRLLSPDLQREVTPANILMRGPTGCGKTEIAKRLAKLAEAPFVKVEATKFTEVGFVGANTSSMIEDLMKEAVSAEEARQRERLTEQAEIQAYTELLAMLGKDPSLVNISMMRSGAFDDEEVDLSNEVFPNSKRRVPRAMDDDDPTYISENITHVIESVKMSMNGGRGGKKKSVRKVKVKDAKDILTNYKLSQMIDEGEVLTVAKIAAEEEGIVFIDEIDKLCTSFDRANTFERKGEGVQKEFLSLLEGATVRTRYGNISTQHILFVCSGAFHLSSPSDLLPELQGRLPVRVELSALTYDDLRRILCEKKFNLIEQTKALLASEGLTVNFTECAIDEIARFADTINTVKENIGARRLSTVMHLVVEELSFIAHRLNGTTQNIDAEYVRQRMSKHVLTNDTLSKYIL